MFVRTSPSQAQLPAVRPLLAEDCGRPPVFGPGTLMLGLATDQQKRS
jgi:hypothetical protein